MKESYQAAWKFIGTGILEVVEESRRNQKVCLGLNAILLSLIPKTSNSDDPHIFRHIALCNVIYKIISTLIVRRLKLILPSIISLEKIGFLEGR